MTKEELKKLKECISTINYKGQKDAIVVCRLNTKEIVNYLEYLNRLIPYYLEYVLDNDLYNDAEEYLSLLETKKHGNSFFEKLKNYEDFCLFFLENSIEDATEKIKNSYAVVRDLKERILKKENTDTFKKIKNEFDERFLNECYR